MARTEVRGPVHGGEILSLIGNDLVETPTRRIFSEDSAGRAVAPNRDAAKRKPRGRATRRWWLVRKSEDPYTGAKLLARSVTNRSRNPTELGVDPVRVRLGVLDEIGELALFAAEVLDL